MSSINRMMECFPKMEVVIRQIYYRIKRFDVVKKSKILKKMQDCIKAKPSKDLKERSWEIYSNYIRNLGVSNGDILIVHSSMDGLAPMNVEEEEIISFLREIVGIDGTLVMPAYPYYKQEEVDLEFAEEQEGTRTYKPATTLSWTGILPNYLCALKEAKRSYFPIDTLVAVGKEASEMIRDNLRGQISHGKYTAWEYCNLHHAKVLFLGISPLDCISEIHLFEDLNEEEWPIQGWYKEQSFIIKNGDERIDFSCKMRKRFWNQYVTEHYCMRQLIRGGILSYSLVEETPIGFIEDLNKMTNYVANCVRRKKDLLFWKIPRKYWKKL